jgi:hypothetical protein
MVHHQEQIGILGKQKKLLVKGLYDFERFFKRKHLNNTKLKDSKLMGFKYGTKS